MVNLEWNELIKKASSKRERRHILTENIVGASGQIGTQNKLIKYNTKEGTIKNGILLHRDFGKEGEADTALLPISEAYPIISKLDLDGFFADHKLSFRAKRISDNYYQVYLNKKDLYPAIIDEKLRKLLRRESGQSQDELPDFVQNAGEMTGTLHIENLQAFLYRLDAFQVQYLGKARELEDWEIENETDWKAQTKQKKGNFKYQLGRAYGQGSNPTIGFVSYEEPNAEYQFGTVIYNRPLTDKEKYNYSLIPIFKNVEEPYQEWKTVILQTGIKEDFNSVVDEVRDVPLHEAIETMGYFILNNLHEDGNAEFVFGIYTAQDLGRVFYEDTIAQISSIDELINQLQIALK
jgi:hypothetical protein